MQSDGYQAADVIPALSVALDGIGLPEVGISCCEGQGWSYARDLLAEVQDAGAEGALSIITTHTYKGTPAKPDRPLNTTLPVWVTEISPIMDRLGMTQTWYRNHSENEGLLNAIHIHEALTTGNVSAYIYWIGVGQSSAEAPFIWAPNLKKNVTREDMWHAHGNNTVVQVENGTTPYTIGSTFWAAAQYSKFIRPGAKRIDVQASEEHPGLLVSAFRNENGNWAVPVINNGDQPFEVVLDLNMVILRQAPREGCWIVPWLTNDEDKLQRVGRGWISVDDDDSPMTVPPRSIMTFEITLCNEDLWMPKLGGQGR